MEKCDIIIGCVITGCTIAIITVLTVWAMRTIDRIAKGGYRTARQTLKELNGGK